MFKAARNAIAMRHIQDLCARDFKDQASRPNERPVEYRFLFEQLTETAPVTVLDVGTGITAIPSVIASCGMVVTAVDNIRDFWPQGMFNRHFQVIDDDITASKLEGRFDLIACISVLEHIRNHDVAVDSMFRLLNPGGHLVLTCPYSESRYCPNVYKQPDSDAFGREVPFICQSYSRVELGKWTARNQGVIVKQEFWRFYSGEFWSCGARINPPQKAGPDAGHQITCLLIRKPGQRPTA